MSLPKKANRFADEYIPSSRESELADCAQGPNLSQFKDGNMDEHFERPHVSSHDDYYVAYKDDEQYLIDELEYQKFENACLKKSLDMVLVENEYLKSKLDGKTRSGENRVKMHWMNPSFWVSSLFKCFDPFFSGDYISRQGSQDKQSKGRAGVSILARADNNKRAAQKLLQQLIEVNTFSPVEVILLFDQANAKNFQIKKGFARKLSLRIFSAKGRTFGSLMPELYYDQTLILTMPLDWRADPLPKAAQQLRESEALYLALEVPEQALLLKTEAMTCFAERFLMAPVNILHQSLASKAALIPEWAEKLQPSQDEPQTKPHHL